MGVPENFDLGGLSLGDEFDGLLDNEEELQISVANKDDRVMVSFSQSMKWLSLEPQEAMALANAILNRAIELSKKPTE